MKLVVHGIRDSISELQLSNDGILYIIGSEVTARLMNKIQIQEIKLRSPAQLS